RPVAGDRGGLCGRPRAGGGPVPVVMDLDLPSKCLAGSQFERHPAELRMDDLALSFRFPNQDQATLSVGYCEPQDGHVHVRSLKGSRNIYEYSVRALVERFARHDPLLMGS